MAQQEARATELAASLAGAQEAFKLAEVGLQSVLDACIARNQQHLVGNQSSAACPPYGTMHPAKPSLSLQAEHAAALEAKAVELATAMEARVG